MAMKGLTEYGVSSLALGRHSMRGLRAGMLAQGWRSPAGECSAYPPRFGDRGV